MNRLWLFIIAGILAIEAVGCAPQGGQTGNNNNYTPYYSPDTGTETDTEPFTYIDGFITCEPEDTYDEGEITCYVDS